MKVDLCSMTIGNPELMAVERVLRSGRVTSGPQVAELERRLQIVTDMYALAVNSGTSALLVALCLVKEEKERNGVEDWRLLIPDLTYAAVYNAAVTLGLDDRVRVVDCNDNGVVDVETIGRVVDSSNDVIVIAHNYLTICDYSAIAQAFQFNDIIVDAAHAHPTAGYADHPNIKAVVYSFFASKIVSAGEGGALCVRDYLDHDLAMRYRGQGVKSPGLYDHQVPGLNLRMTEVSAALALCSLEKLESNISRRCDILNAYSHGEVPLVCGNEVTPWLVLAQCRRWSVPLTRMKFELAGVETRRVFPPISTLPYYFAFGSHAPADSKAHHIYNTHLCLPLHPQMTDEQVQHVINAAKEIL